MYWIRQYHFNSSKLTSVIDLILQFYVLSFYLPSFSILLVLKIVHSFWVTLCKWKFTMIMRRLFFFLAANSSFSPTSFYFLCSFFLPSIIYCLSLTRIGNCLFANSLTTTSTTIRRVVVAVMFFAWCLLQLLLLLSLALVEEVQLHSLVHHAAAHRENRRK